MLIYAPREIYVNILLNKKKPVVWQS